MFLYNKLEFGIFIYVTTERPSILAALHILLGNCSFCHKDDLTQYFMSFQYIQNKKE